MIRFVAIGCLLSLLALSLYLPAAYPADHFLLQLKVEYDRVSQTLGDTTAHDVLTRSLNWSAAAPRVPQLPATMGAQPEARSVPNAVAAEMNAINSRILGNAYLRSVESLTALAAFRLSTITEWLAWLTAFGAAAIVDSRIKCRVRSQEFRRQDPEAFSILIVGALLVTTALAVATLMPWPLHPSLVPLNLIAAMTLAAGSFAHIRREG